MRPVMSVLQVQDEPVRKRSVRRGDSVQGSRRIQVRSQSQRHDDTNERVSQDEQDSEYSYEYESEDEPPAAVYKSQVVSGQSQSSMNQKGQQVNPKYKPVKIQGSPKAVQVVKRSRDENEKVRKKTEIGAHFSYISTTYP